MLALIGGGALLLSPPDNVVSPEGTLTEPTVVQSSVAATVVSSTPDATTPDVVSNPAWTQVVTPREVFGDALLKDVIVFGDLLVVRGEIATGEEEYEDRSGSYTVGSPAMWTSIDGETWVPIDPAGPVPRGSMVAGGPGLVSIAIVDGLPMSWLSTDGTSWTEIPLDRDVFADWEVCGQLRPPNLDAVWSAGPIVIAHRQGTCSDAHYPGRVWVTTDGYEWTSLQPDAFGEDWPNGWDTTSRDDNSMSWSIHDVAGTDDVIVAVGNDLGPAIWVSTDGYTWEQIGKESLGPAPSNVRIDQVTTDGSGYIAMGSISVETETEIRASQVWVWTSPDGRDWSAGSTSIDPSIGIVRELFWADGVYLALSWDGELWTSLDGLAWRLEASGPPRSDVRIYGAAIDGSRLYTTGHTSVPRDDGEGNTLGPWQPLLYYRDATGS